MSGNGCRICDTQYLIDKINFILFNLTYIHQLIKIDLKIIYFLEYCFYFTKQFDYYVKSSKKLNQGIKLRIAYKNYMF